MRSAQAVLHAGRVPAARANVATTSARQMVQLYVARQAQARACNPHGATAKLLVPCALGLANAVLTLACGSAMFGRLPPALEAVAATKAHAEHAEQVAVRAGACPSARNAASSTHSDSLSSTERRAAGHARAALQHRTASTVAARVDAGQHRARGGAQRTALMPPLALRCAGGGRKAGRVQRRLVGVVAVSLHSVRLDARGAALARRAGGRG